MQRLKLIHHAPGAPGLRFLGLGPYFLPIQGLTKLQKLLEKHAFWATGRNYKNLRKLLAKSTIVITLWRGKRLIGFGRATSDGVYRAVLWDIVVAGDLQGQGLGRKVVEALLSSPSIKEVERIYLMTTNSDEFYKQLGFKNCNHQKLLIRSKS
ncbi:GNAT family N-acetyltransferase [Prochlorococcus marinus]|uniref:GNAT family N-acetyltransferase n=1 Tax=Prochlorococcus marinus TaxID=1219 RepID=UPI0022B3113C|nr:GNAT family N-acetyltransferase [Prochlorococcus marinus]